MFSQQRLRYVLASLVSSFYFLLISPIFADVVINEIHYNPDVKTEPVEFVELYNTASNEVTLTGWTITDGISYSFPPGSSIAGGGYVVVAENAAAFQVKFGVVPLGVFQGRLDNDSDRIELRDASGDVVDEVDYKLGFPWPTVGDGPGLSIELVHPSLDNSLGGSWRASIVGNFSDQNQTVLPSGSSWKYFKGLTEASTPRTAWRQLAFNDSTWLNGTAPIGYGEPELVVTELADMRGVYGAVFFRKTFVVDDPALVKGLTLEAIYDDGFKAWINGTLVVDANANMPPGEVTFDSFSSTSFEIATFVSLSLGAPLSSFLVQETNILAVQAHNTSLNGSADFFFDARLSARLGSSGSGRGPTPGAANAVFATNNPPQIRDVTHEPKEPRAGQTVQISAKVTDPDGVGSVTLQYQLVDPGSYINLTDPAFTNNWTSVVMRDDGTGGDADAGDNVYTAELGGSVQIHRRLVRYRLVAVDAGNRSIRVPYADDPQPNFAYFVYNGVPSWRGSTQPGMAPVITYPPEVMGRLPVFHLLSKRTDVETSTWNEKYLGDLYKWAGTLVYDGQIYDHIHYRARGGVWRYAMGKNMWKFRLNRGHELDARDKWGRKYTRRWTRLNFGSSIQQGDFNHRGEQGMFESVGFKLFNLAGIESPDTSFGTFRIIDDAVEANPSSQFDGDFWGVYLVTEQEDGRFLDHHGLPDGNLYKMENNTGPGNGELVNQGPTQVTDSSDLVSFTGSMDGQTDQWWRDNLDLPKYFNYQAILQGIHHFDVCCGKNYYYYHNPVTGKWEVHTWDLDLTWADNMYVGGVSGGTEPFRSRVLGDFNNPPSRPQIRMEFRNRLREIRDLLFNQDQAFRVIDEFAELLRGTNTGPTILDADRAQWDYNPIMINGSIVNLSKAGHGRYYAWPNEPTVTKDFKGAVQLMKNYVVVRSTQANLGSGGGGLDGLALDAAIPARPVISSTSPGDFPLNRLTFRTSSYSGANPFAALKWRLAEITPTNAPASNPQEPNKYEIETSWETPELTIFSSDVTVPSSQVRVGATYRVRARFKDNTGRWSQWSGPIEFVTAEPDSAAGLLANLRVSELMYNSPAGSSFDFVELHNLSPTLTLDLNGAKFTQGIDYTFGPGENIPPGGYLIVINNTNPPAFRAYYGLDINVPLAGPFVGNFANGGETVTLRTSAGGTDIAAFEYADERGWPLPADGSGHSLVPLESAIADQASGMLSYGGNWRASGHLKGSPGAADPAPAPPVLLNEVVAHTDFTAEFDSNDWIELYNPGATNFTFGADWYLSDDADPTNLNKWMIPPGTIVPAHGWISFDERTGFHNPTNIGFGLNKAGEQVLLSYLPGTSEDRIVDSISFKGQENGWSLGRYPDGGPFWQALNPTTRDASNAAPALHVVISEVMYHPPDAAGVDNSLDEYIELFNPGGQPVELFDTNGTWRIDGGVTFPLPANITLAAQQYLLIVNFDPADATQLSAFRTAYGITDLGLLIIGPYAGKLGNSTQRVALEKPQAPDGIGETVSWIIVDEVIYADRAPWQLAADGFGPSLQRQDSLRPGNDPANWQAASPSLGDFYGGGMAPTITTQPVPASLTSPAGANITYTVGATGDQPLQYQWLFNGATLSGQTGPDLALVNVQPGHSGSYSVLALNAAGSMLSDTVTLFVTTPPRITAQPLAVPVRPGTNVTFSVNAVGSGTLFYQWRFNGQDIAGANSGSYLIANVQEEHDGFYTVVVTDMNGSIFSEPARLTVLIQPAFVLHPISQAVLPGSTVTFSVQTSGTLPMGYRWRRGTTDVTNLVLGSHVSFLTITNVQATNAGNYRVIITNAAFHIPGYQSSIATLTVLTDTDGDGMDNAWETNNGFDPNLAADAGQDFDGDGLTNKQEYDSGTDPRDATSYLKIESLDADFISTGAVRIRFLAMGNRTYTVQSRDALQPSPWSRVADVVASATNRVVEILDQPGVGIQRRYYRLATPRVP